MPLLLVPRDAEPVLLKLHESGMGYQIVRIVDRLYVVFNATLALPLEELKNKRFSSSEYRLLTFSGDRPSPMRLKQLEMLEQPQLVFSVLDSAHQNVIPGLGLIFNAATAVPPSSLTAAVAPMAYFRFSPFKRDKRVDPVTGDFLPGTYATTYAEVHHVPSGFAAVGRFALPNPASASNVFPIVTAQAPSIFGTVAPNFGQAGGGVEVLFSKGATHVPGHSFAVTVG